jgi:predicted glycosyltransferase involved in capsule biosynthesis
MNFLMFLKKLNNGVYYMIRFFLKLFGLYTPKISLLIPFSSTDPNRISNLKWLLKYWKHHLPDAEIIIGHSKSSVFCKGEALNNAVRKSKGKVLAILDADAYLSASIIEKAANKILEYSHNHLWLVPYRKLYRLNKEITEVILSSNPLDPFFPEITPFDIQPNSENSINYGRRYGAMLMVFPREAYDLIGGFDERFKGWGGEDVCLLKALDTLYGKHKTIKGNIYHLWHPVYGDTYQSRRWEGQQSGSSNWKLSKQYSKAVNRPSMMKKIIEESKDYRNENRNI